MHDREDAERLARLEEKMSSLRADVDALETQLGSSAFPQSVRGRLHAIENEERGQARATEAVREASKAVQVAHDRRWTWPQRLLAFAVSLSAVGGFVLQLVHG